MPCCTQPLGTQGCEIQHKKGDRGVVGCRINLGIYDLLICTSLNLNRSIARLRSSVPPGVISLPRTIEKRCIFFVFLNCRKVLTPLLLLVQLGDRGSRDGAERERDARGTQKRRGSCTTQPREVCYSSEGFIFILCYKMIPHSSAYCSSEEDEEVSAHAGE